MADITLCRLQVDTLIYIDPIVHNFKTKQYANETFIKSYRG